MENLLGEKKHVFISYSSKEVDIAVRVCEYLEANGIPCWIAPRNVDAGGNYPTQIVTAIKTCEMLVLLASENTNASGHVTNEVSIAFDNRKIIIFGIFFSCNLSYSTGNELGLLAYIGRTANCNRI